MARIQKQYIQTEGGCEEKLKKKKKKVINNKKGVSMYDPTTLILNG